MVNRAKNTPFFAIQTIGKRDEQEDSYGICYDFQPKSSPVPNCFVLADGMGGHSGGKVASQIAIDSVKLVVEDCDSFDERTLRDSLSAANLNIAECVKLNSELEGMGTTLVVLTIIGDNAFWISVGDSPLLSLDNNHELRLLNEDHSMRPVLDKLVESGVLEKDNPEYQKKVSQLRSALTGDNIELYDLNSAGVSLAESKYLVLSSDGLDTLSREEVKNVMVANAKKGPKAIASELINAIDKKGSPKQDNTTLIVIDPLAYRKAKMII
jgi:serine/threonine protein phosphatase PrpC|tara:strand:+ start:157 stop:960 length:804 start_codon:yes stop_codon:yes gene_type:complete